MYAFKVKAGFELYAYTHPPVVQQHTLLCTVFGVSSGRVYAGLAGYKLLQMGVMNPFTPKDNLEAHIWGILDTYIGCPYAAVL